MERQLMRGKQIREHNAMVNETGQGELLEERVTDYDEMVCIILYHLLVDVKNFKNLYLINLRFIS